MIHIADVILTLDQIGRESVNYHQEMHMRGGHESNGGFVPWKNNRKLYQTGNLFNSYQHAIYGLSLDGGSVRIRNAAFYSPFLEDKGFPHVYKSERVDEIVETNVHQLMKQLIMS